MFDTSPFYDLLGFLTPAVMQIYVVAMFLAVVVGVIIDVIHKKSAQYFFENAQKAQQSATRTVTGGEKASLAISTLTNEVLTSSEFCNPHRRMSHLLTMYGFIIFVVTTATLIFAYPTPAEAAPGMLVVLWHIGALMVCVGGYWFWFFIRVDLNSEGNPWYRLVPADLFILSLLATTTFALLWSFGQAYVFWGTLFFCLFILSSTMLFCTVLWSKFAHMFFKPAAAYQKKIIMADGSRENLPELGELTDADLQTRYPDIPTYMGEKPPYMGLGIKRESPNHY
ncbi:MAG: adenylyl-sulfate reductase [Gammaproteobacteria bacterium]|nr:adenylyl-sulfate reductase [Gammaproteobacteria bacterium]MDH3856851.1 adenylyl-sulfate reductase [Gammaproteobacteria bacterium]